jgi:heme-degrading monooxygenase HmoA
VNAQEGYTLVLSHTVWQSEEDFQNWAKSESFRAAHRNAGDHKAMYKAPPVFEGFNVVNDI